MFALAGGTTKRGNNLCSEGGNIYRRGQTEDVATLRTPRADHLFFLILSFMVMVCGKYQYVFIIIVGNVHGLVQSDSTSAG
jgi:hypothetical protein